MKFRKAVLSDINVITGLWKDMMLLHQKYDRYFSLEEKAEKDRTIIKTNKGCI